MTETNRPEYDPHGDSTVDGAFVDGGLTALATRRPVAVLMVVLMVLTFGLISFRLLPRSLMPDISYPSLTVRTEYPGASPLDVEQRISRRLEAVLAQVRGLKRISSSSRAEVSDVVLEFGWDMEMTAAAMEVRERVEQARLPDEAPKPTIRRYDPSLDPILQVALFRKESRRDRSGEGVSQGWSSLEAQQLVDLRLLAEETVRRRAQWGEGFAAVQIQGGLEREIRVDIRADQLRAQGIPIERVTQRLAEENLNQASGILYEGDQARLVRTVNEFEDIREIGEIILKREGGVPVRLKEVAAVQFGYADPEVLTRVDGRPCVKLEFYKEADANLVDVADGIRERIFGTPREQDLLREYRDWTQQRDEKDGDPEAAGEQKESDGKEGADGRGKEGPPVRPEHLLATLPESVGLQVLSDPSQFIARALVEVRQTALVGGILATGILFLFLRNGWFTLAVGLSIPVSVIATFTALYLQGVSLNLMSLGGIALGIGMLVDTSIVVLESIFRCQEDGDSPARAAVRGTRQVASAVTASTLTTVCVFLPMIFVEGVAGQVFRDQALTVVMSLIASLIVALYFLPTLVCHRPDFSPRSPESGQRTPSARSQAVGMLRRQVTEIGAWRRRLRGGLGILAVPLVLLLVVFFLVTFLLRWLLEWVGVLLSAALAWGLLGVRLSIRGVRWVFSWGGRHRMVDPERFFRAVQEGYSRLLKFSLRRRAWVLAFILFGAGGATFFFVHLGSELIPKVHQGEFTLEVRLPVGTRVEHTDRILRPLEKRILDAKATLGIASVTTTVGVERDSIKAGDEGEHTATLLIRLERGRNPRRAEEEVRAWLRGRLAREAELSEWIFRQPVLFSFKTPIEVEVKGYNLEELRTVTRDLSARLQELPALKDVRDNMAPGYPEARLRFDRDLLNRHGLTVEGVGSTVRRMVLGEVPTYFSEGDDRIGLRVRLAESERQSLEELAEVVLNPGAEAPIALREVLREFDGHLEVGEGPAEIRRVGNQRAGVVTANLTGMDLGGVTSQVEDVLARLQRPTSFSVGFGGQKEEMDLSLQQLATAFALAIFLVYVVLAIQFESLVQPFVILSAVPLAMLGVAPVLYALEIPLSIVVFIGMIVLAGIVVNNAIVLVTHVNYLREDGLSLQDALVAAGRIRLRPILMTTLTTVLALLPSMGLFDGIPGLDGILGVGDGVEVRAPLAITVISGLSASTLLTLIVVPVFYSLVAAKAPVRRRDEVDRQDEERAGASHG